MLSSFQYTTATDSSSNVENALGNGLVIMVYFWDSTCADCSTSDDIMDDIEDYYGTSVYIISLNLDNGETTLVNLYDIEELPTVVIYDELAEHLTDEPYAILRGLKTFAYYSSKINEALVYDDNLRASAETFYLNAERYFDLEEYDTSKYYYESAKEIYDDLGDVYNSITCSQRIIKCDKYIEANADLSSADDYYSEGSYVLAKEQYQSALTNFDFLSDDAKVSYCNSQIQKCELYPSLQSDYDDALLLMSANDYASALTLLGYVKTGYSSLEEDEVVSDIDVLINKCNDYILAANYYSEATSALNNQNYELAISKYQYAKDIYEDYSDSEKVSLCDQNIAIAQQFLNLQTPVPTTPPSNSTFNIDRKYLLYGGGGFALLLIFLALFVHARSNGNKTYIPKEKPKKNVSAIKRASEQFTEDEGAPSSIDLGSEGVQQTLEERPPAANEELDSFVSFQEKTINIKNSLLVNFVQWVDEFFDELDPSNKDNYFIYRERFDELYAFYARSFSSDEAYLDQGLMDIAKSRLQQIQSKLNDMMDVI